MIDTGLLSLLVLALTIGVVGIWRRECTKAVIAGAVAGSIATAMAAIVFVAIDHHEFSLVAIIWSPVFESAVIGAFAAAGFKLASTRLHGASLVALATVCAGVLGFLLGSLLVGHSPHFSHDSAVLALVTSWFLVSLVASSTYVLSRET